jgi:tRNA G26 N,N-dimethylase Trm1
LGFNFDLMCKNIKSVIPNRKILYAGLESQGFQVEPSYIIPGIYKTNAPFQVIYDLIKYWKLNNMGEEKYMNNVK